VPEFNEDVEALGEPARVREIKEHIARADALLFAVPEYNYGLPGWFKNVLDWVSRPPAATPLRKKPAGMISASLGPRGGARAQMALRQTLVYTETYAMPRPEMFVGNAAALCDESGQLTNAAAREELRRYLQALIEWAQLLRPVERQ
jgi:chromate reductase